MNLNWGYLFGGKYSRTLYVYNCLFDPTYYFSSTAQSCSVALVLFQMSFSFLFSVPPPLGDVLRMYREMDNAEFTPLSINSNSRVYMSTYNLCVLTPPLGYQTNNMLGVRFLKMMPATGKYSCQVGHTGPVGFWVNHIVLAAVTCRYNCDLTIIQSMPDDTNALVPLSGKNPALSLTDEHYDETTQ